MISLSLVPVREEEIPTIAPGHVTLLVPRALPALTINILTVPGLGSFIIIQAFDILHNNKS